MIREPEDGFLEKDYLLNKNKIKKIFIFLRYFINSHLQSFRNQYLEHNILVTKMGTYS